MPTSPSGVRPLSPPWLCSVWCIFSFEFFEGIHPVILRAAPDSTIMGLLKDFSRYQGSKPSLRVCKASSPPAILSLWPLLCSFHHLFVLLIFYYFSSLQWNPIRLCLSVRNVSAWELKLLVLLSPISWAEPVMKCVVGELIGSSPPRGWFNGAEWLAVFRSQGHFIQWD